LAPFRRGSKIPSPAAYSRALRTGFASVKSRAISGWPSGLGGGCGAAWPVARWASDHGADPSARVLTAKSSGKFAVRRSGVSVSVRGYIRTSSTRCTEPRSSSTQIGRSAVSWPWRS
jgi:hypothetical protein